MKEKKLKESETELQSKIMRVENQLQMSTFDVGEIFLVALHDALNRLNNKNGNDKEEDGEKNYNEHSYVPS
jgi:hypothetical protein